MTRDDAAGGPGIEDLGLYCGRAAIGVRELFDGRGLDPGRFGNLMMSARSVQLPWEDPVTNAVNAAAPVVGRLDAAARDRIELLVVSTESGLDFSKSVASYVHHHLGLSRRCRVLDVKQACYGATGMLQLAAGYLRGNGDRDARALVIATDVNPMDAHARYAEPTTGHGAAAILVGAPIVLDLDRGASGLHSFEVLDTARPTPTLDFYDTDRSLLAYLECASASYDDYRRRVPSTDFVASFDYLVMHSPFGGMVKAAHRKLMREHHAATPAEVADDFARRVAPSLTYVAQVGNMFSGSLYLALAGLVDSLPTPVAVGARIGLYAYGSGCASEFFSGVLGPGASRAIGGLRLAERLADRRTLSFAEYEELLPSIRECLVPVPHREVDLSAVDDYAPSDRGEHLVLSGVEEYHRKYEWR